MLFCFLPNLERICQIAYFDCYYSVGLQYKLVLNHLTLFGFYEVEITDADEYDLFAKLIQVKSA